ncbi:uracil-DNA glycosylase-like protein, partial [Lineolata rhizophorae]
SPSPSKKQKRHRKPSRYADPSKYAHLAELQDIFAPGLIAIFVGFNPGVATATAGHAYAHPSNMFWKLLHTSGLTPDRRLRPEEDGTLPALYALGNTNLVARPSRDVAELSKEEMAAGTPILEAKVRKWRPEAVCIVGKAIWESIWRWKHGRAIRKDEFRYGWQDERENMGRITGIERDENGKACEELSSQGPWEGARVFVATSTSGLSASLKPAEKEAIWKPFGNWVQERR